MGMDRQLKEWDDEFETAQAKLVGIRRAEDKSRINLGEARSRYERAKSMWARAQKKETEVRSSEREARRRSEEAQRRGDEARRKGLAQHRWIAESRQWTREAQRQAEDLLRWQEDVRRKDREMRTSNEDVKGEIAEVAALVKGGHAWELKMKFLVQNRGIRPPSVGPRPEVIAKPLAVTGGILKKCVNGQAVYPLSEQDGLKVQERRYTAYGKEKH